MNAIANPGDIRKAVVDSLSKPSEDIARHVLAMAGTNPSQIEKAITTGTGLVAYDLQAPAKNLSAAAAGIDALAGEVKQGASDVLGIGATVLGAAQPAIVTGVNSAADAGLLALTGGAATPAIPAFNNLIDGIVNTGVTTLQAWALKQKGLLAGSAAAPAKPAAS